jgi:hypothetical protein
MFNTLGVMIRWIAVLLCFWAAPALAATCSAAASGGTAPPTWQTYCWLDFVDYNDATARSAAGQNFSYLLADGATLTFNVKTTNTAPIVASAAPSWTGSAVGNSAFLGIPGRPVLYQNQNAVPDTPNFSTITISNILITPPAGVSAITAYMFVAADAESTDGNESIVFTTNGNNWELLDAVDPITGFVMPTSAGLGTQTFTTTGGGATGYVGGYIVGSSNPTTVTATLNGSGLEGVMFAVRFASMRLTKVIGGARVDPTDQFRFDIRSTTSGVVMGTGTTSGTATGPFQAAAVSLASGIPLTISETMAPGSASALSKYESRLSCFNGTGTSSTPLPNNVLTTSYSFGTLQFGDAIQCTFTNRAFPHVTLRKALGTGGRFTNTDQFTMQVRNSANTGNLATSTTTGTGATITAGTGVTAQTQLVAGTPYTVREVASGTTVLTNYSSVLSCVNAATGSPTNMPNLASNSGTITLQLGDVVTCTITNTRKTGNAVLTIAKSSSLISDPVNNTINPKAIPGAIVRYTLTVTSSGALSTDNNTVVIVDPLPSELAVGTAASPAFINGTTASGLTFTAASDVRYSNVATPPASFADCAYTPTSAYDPNVRYVCIRPQGSMLGATGTNQPSFTVSFQARIK